MWGKILEQPVQVFVVIFTMNDQTTAGAREITIRIANQMKFQRQAPFGRVYRTRFKQFRTLYRAEGTKDDDAQTSRLMAPNWMWRNFCPGRLRMRCMND